MWESCLCFFTPVETGQLTHYLLICGSIKDCWLMAQNLLGDQNYSWNTTVKTLTCVIGVLAMHCEAPSLLRIFLWRCALVSALTCVPLAWLIFLFHLVEFHPVQTEQDTRWACKKLREFLGATYTPMDDIFNTYLYYPPPSSPPSMSTANH